VIATPFGRNEGGHGLVGHRALGPFRRGEAGVELELVPDATHFWNGAGDVDAIVRRSVEFLRAL
jgi:hypothetical protein